MNSSLLQSANFPFFSRYEHRLNFLQHSKRRVLWRRKNCVQLRTLRWTENELLNEKARAEIPTLYNQFMVRGWNGRWVISEKIVGYNWDECMKAKKVNSADWKAGFRRSNPKNRVKCIDRYLRRKDNRLVCRKITEKFRERLGLIGKLCYYRKIIFLSSSCMMKYSTLSSETHNNSSFSSLCSHLHIAREREKDVLPSKMYFHINWMRWRSERRETSGSSLSSKSYMMIQRMSENVLLLFSRLLFHHHTQTQYRTQSTVHRYLL